MEDIIKQAAYKIVLEDMIENGTPLFVGKYDAKHGSAEFMCGIETVMEVIAYAAGDENFDNMFLENLVESKRQAKNDK